MGLDGRWEKCEVRRQKAEGRRERGEGRSERREGRRKKGECFANLQHKIFYNIQF